MRKSEWRRHSVRLPGHFEGGEPVPAVRDILDAGVRAVPSRSTLAAALLFLLSTTALSSAQQLPTGGTVAAGSATIGTPQNGTLTINQTSQRAVLDWTSFSIGRGGTVNFNQPNAAAATLNRVSGSTPSTIAGTINAPGTVLLVNPNGIAITSSGVVNVGSFAASTLNIKDQDFMAGNYRFSGNGASATVTNAGRINVSDGGFAALLGGSVANSGVISARLGKVGLASGELVTLDLAGDGFLSVAVPTSQLGNIVDAQGRPLVSNTGKIKADGGAVYLRAATAATLLRDAVNVPGSIRANSVGTRNGKIVIGGGAGGNVKISGRLAANGRKGGNGGSVSVTGADIGVSGKISAKGQSGGRIDVTGTDVALAGASIDVSGLNGGGIVNIGGNALGKGPLANAITTSADAATTIRADATQNGNGGSVVVWSDDATTFKGTISARGGAQGGDGGQVETSGHSLDIAGATVDAGAAKGKAGAWLLDPYDLTVAGSDATTIASSLNSGTAVTLTTSATGSSGPGTANSAGVGDITINAPIAWSTTAGLTLSAYRNVVLNANLSASAAAPITLAADNTGTGTGTVTFGSGIAATTAGTATLFYNPSAYTTPTSFSGSVTATGGLTAYMLVNTADNLQTGVASNLSGTYALGRDIDLSSISNFTPIGRSPVFSGVFNGQGHTISNLTINSTTGSTGLFGETGTGSSISNLTLSNVNITTTRPRTGALVGISAGTISNVSASGTVTVNGAVQFTGGLVGGTGGGSRISNSSSSVTVNALTNGASYIGGLAGQHWVDQGISNSYATGAVNVGNATNVGGLVGGNNSALSNSYATGTVTAGSGATAVGGLVGLNASSVSNVYSTGSVSAAGATNVGGLVGSNSGTVTNGFWNTETSGQATSAAGTGKTTAQMQSLATFTGAGWSIDDAGGTASTWRIYDGNTYPLLRALLTPLTATYADQSKAYDGSTYGGSFGTPTLSVPGASLSGSATVIGSATSAVNAGSYALKGSYFSNQAGYDISYAGALTINKATLSALSGSKTYDASTAVAASAFGTNGTIATGVNGETLALSGNGSVASANVGSGLALNLAGLTLGNGTGLASNYQFGTGNTATIGKATLGALSGNKTYDGNTAFAATSFGSAGTIATGVNGETLVLSGSAAAAGANVGSGLALNLAGLTLGNGTGLATNYQFGSGNTGAITQRALTITGISGTNKVYDATAAATLAGTAALANTVSGDDVSLSGTVSAAFADKNVGAGKAVTVSGYTLAGTAAANYTLSQPAGVTADITAKSIAVTGVTAANKVYDATTAATLGGTAALSGVISGDTVTLGGTGSGAFADKNVAAGKAVAVSGYSISGGDAGNYTLSQPAGVTADITAKSIAVTGVTAANKVYDATTAATLGGTAALSGVISGDTVMLGGTGSGAFADKNVAAGKAVAVSGYTILGGDAGNYALSQPSGVIADITAKSIAVTGVTAANKVYDATTAATLGGTAALSGVISGDMVTLGGTGSGAFADKNVAAGKAVTVSGYTISGGDAGNYALSQPSGVIADITAKSIAVTGVTAANKVYDATTAATLGGTAALSGVISGDTVTLGGTGSGAFADKNVAAGKAVAVSGYSISGGDAGNYALSQPAGITADITAATLTYLADAKSRVYGDANPALTGSVTGFQGADTLTNATTGAAAFATAATAASGVGSYAINGSGLAANNGNYVFVQAGGNGTALTVSARSIEVTADAQSKQAGQPDPTLTWALTAGTLVGGDSLSGALARLAGESAGVYPINQGTLAASANYALSFVGADLTISGAPATTGSGGTAPSQVNNSNANNGGTPAAGMTPTQTTAVGNIVINTAVGGAPVTGGVTGGGGNVVTGGIGGNNNVSGPGGLAFQAISYLNQGEYSNGDLPSADAQTSQAAVLVMIGRALGSTDLKIDTLLNGGTAQWSNAPGSISGRAVFGDGNGTTRAPSGDNGFAFANGATDIAGMLKQGPVILGGTKADGAGGATLWMLATSLTPDGKGIVANDPTSGQKIVLAYDPQTKIVGDPVALLASQSQSANLNGGVQSQDVGGSSSPQALNGVKGFVPASYFAVTIVQ